MPQHVTECGEIASVSCLGVNLVPFAGSQPGYIGLPSAMLQ